jgi:hypothetical protein
MNNSAIALSNLSKLGLWLGIGLSVCGCGTYVPQLEEFWEPVTVPLGMEFKIKAKIFCDTVHALRSVKYENPITINGRQALPDDYGVQMQINLTAQETGALNPSVSANNILPNAIRNAVTVPQSFTFTGAATLSSDATRTDTSYSYYNVANISRPTANSWCEKPPVDLTGNTPFLTSDLGIEKFLRSNLAGAGLLSSSSPAKGGAGKTAKLDVYSYEVKFIVVTSGGITPTWKLVNISANTGNLPLASAGRTRTNDLILTFGPGTNNPTIFAQNTHFTNQIVQSNQRLQSVFQHQQSGF